MSFSDDESESISFEVPSEHSDSEDLDPTSPRATTGSTHITGIASPAKTKGSPVYLVERAPLECTPLECTTCSGDRKHDVCVTCVNTWSVEQAKTFLRNRNFCLIHDELHQDQHQEDHYAQLVIWMLHLSRSDETRPLIEHAPITPKDVARLFQRCSEILTQRSMHVTHVTVGSVLEHFLWPTEAASKTLFGAGGRRLLIEYQADLPTLVKLANVHFDKHVAFSSDQLNSVSPLLPLDCTFAQLESIVNLVSAQVGSSMPPLFTLEQGKYLTMKRGNLSRLKLRTSTLEQLRNLCKVMEAGALSHQPPVLRDTPLEYEARIRYLMQWRKDSTVHLRHPMFRLRDICAQAMHSDQEKPQCAIVLRAPIKRWTRGFDVLSGNEAVIEGNSSTGRFCVFDCGLSLTHRFTVSEHLRWETIGGKRTRCHLLSEPAHSVVGVAPDAIIRHFDPQFVIFEDSTETNTRLVLEKKASSTGPSHYRLLDASFASPSANFYTLDAVQRHTGGLLRFCMLCVDVPEIIEHIVENMHIEFRSTPARKSALTMSRALDTMFLYTQHQWRPWLSEHRNKLGWVAFNSASVEAKKTLPALDLEWSKRLAIPPTMTLAKAHRESDIVQVRVLIHQLLVTKTRIGVVNRNQSRNIPMVLEECGIYCIMEHIHSYTLARVVHDIRRRITDGGLCFYLCTVHDSVPLNGIETLITLVHLQSSDSSVRIIFQHSHEFSLARRLLQGKLDFLCVGDARYQWMESEKFDEKVPACALIFRSAKVSWKVGQSTSPAAPERYCEDVVKHITETPTSSLCVITPNPSQLENLVRLHETLTLRIAGNVDAASESDVILSMERAFDSALRNVTMMDSSRHSCVTIVMFVFNVHALRENLDAIIQTYKLETRKEGDIHWRPVLIYVAPRTSVELEQIVADPENRIERWYLSPSWKEALAYGAQVCRAADEVIRSSAAQRFLRETSTFPRISVSSESKENCPSDQLKSLLDHICLTRKKQANSQTTSVQPTPQAPQLPRAVILGLAWRVARLLLGRQTPISLMDSIVDNSGAFLQEMTMVADPKTASSVVEMLDELLLNAKVPELAAIRAAARSKLSSKTLLNVSHMVASAVLLVTRHPESMHVDVPFNQHLEQWSPAELLPRTLQLRSWLIFLLHQGGHQLSTDLSRVAIVTSHRNVRTNSPLDGWQQVDAATDGITSSEKDNHKYQVQVRGDPGDRYGPRKIQTKEVIQHLLLSGRGLDWNSLYRDVSYPYGLQLLSWMFKRSSTPLLCLFSTDPRKLFQILTHPTKMVSDLLDDIDAKISSVLEYTADPKDTDLFDQVVPEHMAVIRWARHETRSNDFQHLLQLDIKLAVDSNRRDAAAVLTLLQSRDTPTDLLALHPSLAVAASVAYSQDAEAVLGHSLTLHALSTRDALNSMLPLITRQRLPFLTPRAWAELLTARDSVSLLLTDLQAVLWPRLDRKFEIFFDGSDGKSVLVSHVTNDALGRLTAKIGDETWVIEGTEPHVLGINSVELALGAVRKALDCSEQNLWATILTDLSASVGRDLVFKKEGDKSTMAVQRIARGCGACALVFRPRLRVAFVIAVIEALDEIQANSANLNSRGIPLCLNRLTNVYVSLELGGKYLHFAADQAPSVSDLENLNYQFYITPRADGAVAIFPAGASRIVLGAEKSTETCEWIQLDANSQGAPSSCWWRVYPNSTGLVFVNIEHKSVLAPSDSGSVVLVPPDESVPSVIVRNFNNADLSLHVNPNPLPFSISRELGFTASSIPDACSVIITMEGEMLTDSVLVLRASGSEGISIEHADGTLLTAISVSEIGWIDPTKTDKGASTWTLSHKRLISNRYHQVALDLVDEEFVLSKVGRPINFKCLSPNVRQEFIPAQPEPARIEDKTISFLVELANMSDSSDLGALWQRLSNEANMCWSWSAIKDPQLRAMLVSMTKGGSLAPFLRWNINAPMSQLSDVESQARWWGHTGLEDTANRLRQNFIARCSDDGVTQELATLKDRGTEILSVLGVEWLTKNGLLLNWADKVFNTVRMLLWLLQPNTVYGSTADIKADLSSLRELASIPLLNFTERVSANGMHVDDLALYIGAPWLLPPWVVSWFQKIDGAKISEPCEEIHLCLGRPIITLSAGLRSAPSFFGTPSTTFQAGSIRGFISDSSDFCNRDVEILKSLSPIYSHCSRTAFLNNCAILWRNNIDEGAAASLAELVQLHAVSWLIWNWLETFDIVDVALSLERDDALSIEVWGGVPKLHFHRPSSKVSHKSAQDFQFPLVDSNGPPDIDTNLYWKTFGKLQLGGGLIINKYFSQDYVGSHVYGDTAADQRYTLMMWSRIWAHFEKPKPEKLSQVSLKSDCELLGELFGDCLAQPPTDPDFVHCRGIHGVDGAQGCGNQNCAGKKVCVGTCSTCPDIPADQFNDLKVLLPAFFGLADIWSKVTADRYSANSAVEVWAPFTRGLAQKLGADSQQYHFSLAVAFALGRISLPVQLVEEMRYFWQQFSCPCVFPGAGYETLQELPTPHRPVFPSISTALKLRHHPPTTRPPAEPSASTLLPIASGAPFLASEYVQKETQLRSFVNRAATPFLLHSAKIPVLDVRGFLDVKVSPGFFNIWVKPGSDVAVYRYMAESRLCDQFVICGDGRQPESLAGSWEMIRCFSTRETAWHWIKGLSANTVLVCEGVLLRRHQGDWWPFIPDSHERVGFWDVLDCAELIGLKLPKCVVDIANVFVMRMAELLLQGAIKDSSDCRRKTIRHPQEALDVIRAYRNNPFWGQKTLKILEQWSLWICDLLKKLKQVGGPDCESSVERVFNEAVEFASEQRRAAKKKGDDEDDTDDSRWALFSPAKGSGLRARLSEALMSALHVNHLELLQALVDGTECWQNGSHPALDPAMLLASHNLRSTLQQAIGANSDPSSGYTSTSPLDVMQPSGDQPESIALPQPGDGDIDQSLENSLDRPIPAFGTRKERYCLVGSYCGLHVRRLVVGHVNVAVHEALGFTDRQGLCLLGCFPYDCIQESGLPDTTQSAQLSKYVPLRDNEKMEDPMASDTFRHIGWWVELFRSEFPTPIKVNHVRVCCGLMPEGDNRLSSLEALIYEWHRKRSEQKNVAVANVFNASLTTSSREKLSDDLKLLLTRRDGFAIFNVRDRTVDELVKVLGPIANNEAAIAVIDMHRVPWSGSTLVDRVCRLIRYGSRFIVINKIAEVGLRDREELKRLAQLTLSLNVAIYLINASLYNNRPETRDRVQNIGGRSETKDTLVTLKSLESDPQAFVQLMSDKLWSISPQVLDPLDEKVFAGTTWDPKHQHIVISASPTTSAVFTERLTTKLLATGEHQLPSAYLIFGTPGIGKSKLMQRVKMKHGALFVIYQDFSSTHVQESSMTQMLDRENFRLTKNDARLLIVDEFHLLRFEQKEQVVKWARDQHNLYLILLANFVAAEDERLLKTYFSPRSTLSQAQQEPTLNHVIMRMRNSVDSLFSCNSQLVDVEDPSKLTFIKMYFRVFPMYYNEVMRSHRAVDRVVAFFDSRIKPVLDDYTSGNAAAQNLVAQAVELGQAAVDLVLHSVVSTGVWMEQMMGELLVIFFKSFKTYNAEGTFRLPPVRFGIYKESFATLLVSLAVRDSASTKLSYPDLIEQMPELSRCHPATRLQLYCGYLMWEEPPTDSDAKLWRDLGPALAKKYDMQEVRGQMPKMCAPPVSDSLASWRAHRSPVKLSDMDQVYFTLVHGHIPHKPEDAPGWGEDQPLNSHLFTQVVHLWPQALTLVHLDTRLNLIAHGSAQMAAHALRFAWPEGRTPPPPDESDEYRMAMTAAWRLFRQRPVEPTLRFRWAVKPDAFWKPEIFCRDELGVEGVFCEINVWTLLRWVAKHGHQMMVLTQGAPYRFKRALVYELGTLMSKKADETKVDTSLEVVLPEDVGAIFRGILAPLVDPLDGHNGWPYAAVYQLVNQEVFENVAWPVATRVLWKISKGGARISDLSHLNPDKVQRSVAYSEGLAIMQQIMSMEPSLQLPNDWAGRLIYFCESYNCLLTRNVDQWISQAGGLFKYLSKISPSATPLISVLQRRYWAPVSVKVDWCASSIAGMEAHLALGGTEWTLTSSSLETVPLGKKFKVSVVMPIDIEIDPEEPDDADEPPPGDFLLVTPCFAANSEFCTLWRSGGSMGCTSEPLKFGQQTFRSVEAVFSYGAKKEYDRLEQVVGADQDLKNDVIQAFFEKDALLDRLSTMVEEFEIPTDCPNPERYDTAKVTAQAIPALVHETASELLYFLWNIDALLYFKGAAGCGRKHWDTIGRKESKLRRSPWPK